MTEPRWPLVGAAAVAAFLTAVGPSVGAGTAVTRLTATMTMAELTTKPVVQATPTGRFTATLTTNANGAGTLKWRLQFAKVTGMVVSTHIHIGRPRRDGSIIAHLCGPCTSPKSGTVRVDKRRATALPKGNTYVELHTKDNAHGELRGQIKPATT
jgi:hypothetical protein